VGARGRDRRWLTAMMILLFLGSWRSTAVVMISIPLSIPDLARGASALGQTINVMTVGRPGARCRASLVDDSTVTIENTHRLLEEGMPFDAAVEEGAAGIAVPTLISTLAICCVFVSVFFLTWRGTLLVHADGDGGRVRDAGIVRHIAHADPDCHPPCCCARNSRPTARRGAGLTASTHTYNAGFDRFRDFYEWLLTGILRRRVITPLIGCAVVAAAVVLSLNVGTDFFPQVDGGLIQLACPRAGPDAHRPHRAKSSPRLRTASGVKFPPGTSDWCWTTSGSRSVPTTLPLPTAPRLVSMTAKS